MEMKCNQLYCVIIAIDYVKDVEERNRSTEQFLCWSTMRILPGILVFPRFTEFSTLGPMIRSWPKQPKKLYSRRIAVIFALVDAPKYVYLHPSKPAGDVKAPPAYVQTVQPCVRSCP